MYLHMLKSACFCAKGLPNIRARSLDLQSSRESAAGSPETAPTEAFLLLSKQQGTISGKKLLTKNRTECGFPSSRANLGIPTRAFEMAGSRNGSG